MNLKKMVVFIAVSFGVLTGPLPILIGDSDAATETDTTPPIIERVSVHNSPIKVIINFNEPVEQSSAADTSNYFIDHDIRILSAILEADQRTVTLTIDEPPDAAPNPTGQNGDWTLLFQDEFDGTTLDQDKWTTCYWWWQHWRVGDGCTNEGTSELEFYQEDNVAVSNGVLKLQAREQSIFTVDAEGDEKTYQYTSGMITSGRDTSDRSAPAKFLFQYGYAEIKAKIPYGQGLWPAFWTLPDNHQSRPEIDVMEILGHEPDKVHFHLHHNDVDPGSTWIGSDLSDTWYTFAVDWQPEALIWYVNGIERWRYTDAHNIPESPSYLLLNLAVGGEWPGSPDASTPFPSTYEIDYVRVWQRDENPAAEPLYTLTVNNIKDLASVPNTILPNTEISFRFDNTYPLPPANLRIAQN